MREFGGDIVAVARCITADADALVAFLATQPAPVTTQRVPWVA